MKSWRKSGTGYYCKTTMYDACASRPTRYEMKDWNRFIWCIFMVLPGISRVVWSFYRDRPSSPKAKQKKNMYELWLGFGLSYRHVYLSFPTKYHIIFHRKAMWRAINFLDFLTLEKVNEIQHAVCPLLAYYFIN